MIHTEYGIPVPHGVRKDWEANSMSLEGSGALLRKYRVPDEWGDPSNCVAWFDRFERLRACVGHYPNGRAALLRKDANGKWSITFSKVPAIAAGARSGETPTEARSEASQSGAVKQAHRPSSTTQGDPL